MLRALNIALRTAHLGAMATLVGGHAFGVAPERLTIALIWTLGTGVALASVEAGLRFLWFHQIRGLMTLAKLLLLALVPLLWDLRFPLLLGVVVLASVGSHMPSRFRYYSLLYRRVVPDPWGPGGKKLLQSVETQAPDAGLVDQEAGDPPRSVP